MPSYSLLLQSVRETLEQILANDPVIPSLASKVALHGMAHCALYLMHMNNNSASFFLIYADSAADQTEDTSFCLQEDVQGGRTLSYILF
jgi:hypothetical protein